MTTNTENNVPSFLRLRAAFLQHLGSQGLRLKNMDSLSLYKQLRIFRSAQYPNVKDHDLSYVSHLLWVQRNFELMGFRYDMDAPVFPLDYNFEKDYQIKVNQQVTEQPLHIPDGPPGVPSRPDEDGDEQPLDNPDFQKDNDKK